MFDPAIAATGFGLDGMLERAARLEGELRVESGVGEGNRIVLSAPRGTR